MTPLKALIFALLQNHCSVNEMVELVVEAQATMNTTADLNVHLQNLAAQFETELVGSKVLRCQERLCSTPDQEPQEVTVVGDEKKTWCRACRARYANLITETAEACR